MTIDDLGQMEMTILGGMLRSPDVIGDVVTILRAEDFRQDPHQRIYKAIIALWDAGKPIDAVGVADVLHQRGEVSDVGGYGFVALLLEREPTGAATVHHARAVRERSVIRNLNFAAKEIVRDTELGTGDAGQLLEEAQQKVFRIAETGYGGGAVRLKQAADEFFEMIDARALRKDRLAGVPTGFPDLDELTGGLNDGEVTYLAARTSVGKTSLALQVTKHASIDLGQPVLFVSLEMSRNELVQRLLCGAARVDGRHLRAGRPSREDGERLVEARNRHAHAPLFLDEEPCQRMLRIAATARRLKRQEGLRLLVVDYVQLVEPEDRKAPRHEQVSQVSRRLKALAKELSVPVLALAQLNRAAEEKDRPKLHHLRESGSLEQDADVVLLLHRCENKPGVVEVDVAKNRNGPTGLVRLMFVKKFTRFESYLEGPPPGD